MKKKRHIAPSLTRIVKLITQRNRHKEIDWGEPVGKEILKPLVEKVFSLKSPVKD